MLNFFSKTFACKLSSNNCNKILTSDFKVPQFSPVYACTFYDQVEHSKLFQSWQTLINAPFLYNMALHLLSFLKFVLKLLAVYFFPYFNSLQVFDFLLVFCILIFCFFDLRTSKFCMFFMVNHKR